MLRYFINRLVITIVAVICCVIHVDSADAQNSSLTGTATQEKTEAGTQDSATRNGSTAIPAYVTPYYFYQGPKIKVGAYSEQLTNAKKDTIEKLSKTMKADWKKLPVETMYVLSIRLYDLGLKDESVYWFYAAQYRARLLQSIFKDGTANEMGDEAFELKSALDSFQLLAGEYINGYGFGDLAKLQKTIEKVKADYKELPEFKTVYPKLALKPESAWDRENGKVSEGLDKLSAYIKDNAKHIRDTRKKNKIDGKY